MRDAIRSGFARFGPFRLDVATGELYGQNQRIHLQEQPFQLLEMLIDRPGELVTREQIRNMLWPNGTVVEFDHSINTAIKKLRLALGDSATEPRYIETVARRGYRLMLPVRWVDERSAGPALRAAPQLEPGSPLANQTGKRVSHYRVLEVLGGGGMGVVYAAEDLKLGRRVALKFLPQEVGDEALALERFEREARAASTLNHPNICTVHEFGEHEGQPFIVMELLEGQTLRDRIAGQERFPIHQLLDLSIQITEGLEAAHRQGIIHRDIKPANIFLTSRGEAKILDFGLAKLDGVDLVLAGAEPDAAAHLNLTRTSIAMGTAAYMSPEQVRREKLDTRTDLFSFGLVLYEMATMHQAFSGTTAAILYDSILSRVPIPARELNPQLPPQLGEDIINKALQKDRQLRYQTASEIGADLNSVALGLHQTGSRAKWHDTLARVSAVAATLLIAAAILWFTKTRSHSLNGPLDLKQRQLTRNSSEDAVSSGSISPDGTYLAYADLKGIHTKLIETGETRTISQPDSLRGIQVNWGVVSNWASDGSRFIANANVSGKPPSIWAVPAMGGAPRKLRDDAYAWAVSRDGLWVAFTANLTGSLYREMWRMRLDGEQAAKLFEADSKSGLYGAEWSPDGNRVSYFAAHQAAGNSEIDIESRDLHGGPAVVAGPGNVADWTWSPDGRIIYILAEASPLDGSCNFWERYIDSQTGKPEGVPRRLTNWAGFCMEDPSVTANAKRLVFRKLSPQSTVYVADIQPSGARLGPARRLTMTEGQNYPFAWTADSKAVVFESYRDGRWSIFKQLLDDDTAEPIVTGIQDEGAAFATVSSSGTLLLYMARSTHDGPSTSRLDKLMRVPIGGGGSPELVLTARVYGKPACARPPANLCAIAERTPDGKQLVFTAFDPEKGRLGELARFDSGPATGTQYLWDLSPDGTRIAVLKYSQGVIDILPLNGGVFQKIEVKGWSSLLSLNWDSTGKGILASSQTKTGSVLLRICLTGEAHALWEQKGSIAPWNRPFPDFPSAPWAVPSPDGGRLAIYSWNMSSNMWMIENF
jgi:eukaryotic-like serine/threonine-protein kinase